MGPGHRIQHDRDRRPGSVRARVPGGGPVAKEMHVAIIGAGIVGIATAHALLDQDHAVTIVDPGDQPGRACDGNAGWIAHLDILPLASEKVWRHLPHWLLDPLGPLAVRPAYLPRLAPWLVRFVAC